MWGITSEIVDAIVMAGPAHSYWQALPHSLPPWRASATTYQFGTVGFTLHASRKLQFGLGSLSVGDARATSRMLTPSCWDCRLYSEPRQCAACSTPTRYWVCSPSFQFIRLPGVCFQGLDTEQIVSRLR